MNDIVFRFLISVEVAGIDHKMRTNGTEKSRKSVLLSKRYP